MRYFISGDCHGDFNKINWFYRFNMPQEPSVMILLGDVGLNYWLNKTDKKNKKKLSEYSLTFLLIHGNHEAAPWEIESYKEKEWNGGIVFYEEEYPNILFAKDGEVYQVGDKKAIAIGGAYSVDKEYRLSVGLPWFESEQPTSEIKERVEKQLQRYDWNIDYIFSHTAPLKYEPVDLFLDFINQDKVDKSTEEWLSKIESKLSYEKWWFGHYHGNREYADAYMLFEEIREIGTNNVVQRIGRPKYKKYEMVMFYFNNGNEKIEEYGRIEIIDKDGTFGQACEVSYDILGTDNVLYKHIPESDVFAFKEIKDECERHWIE